MTKYMLKSFRISMPLWFQLSDELDKCYYPCSLLQTWQEAVDGISSCHLFLFFKLLNIFIWKLAVIWGFNIFLNKKCTPTFSWHAAGQIKKKSFRDVGNHLGLNTGNGYHVIQRVARRLYYCKLRQCQNRYS